VAGHNEKITHKNRHTISYDSLDREARLLYRTSNDTTTRMTTSLDLRVSSVEKKYKLSCPHTKTQISKNKFALNHINIKFSVKYNKNINVFECTTKLTWA